MRVDLFDFVLPEELIAQAPVNPRDSSRLLEVTKSTLKDYIFSDLPDLLREGDLLVFNNTKVIPARLIGKCGTAKIDVTLHKNVSEGTWRAFARPAKKLSLGSEFVIADGFSAIVMKKLENGEVELKFNVAGKELDKKLSAHGSMPLPPYIKRKSGEKIEDRKDYQTIYAEKSGAVAAPTAGLHFTDRTFADLEKKNINTCFVTLHVGAGTFLPVKTEDTRDHVMHSEFYEIGEKAATAINKTKKDGGRIVAVGTTSLRTLESFATRNGKISAGNGDTNLFIVPGYRFKVVDLLLTNFHLPRSTLFMLVSAFAGVKTMHEAYKHAIGERYRFFSYGDACLLQRNESAENDY